MYVAKHLIKYNGKKYQRGDEVPLTAAEAADLIKTRVVEEVGGKKTPKAEPVATAPESEPKAETPNVAEPVATAPESEPKAETPNVAEPVATAPETTKPAKAK